MSDRNSESRPHAPFDPSDEQISEAAFHAAMRDARRDVEIRSSRIGALAAFEHSVYALVDPRSSKVCYIGVAIDPERRYRQHIDLDRRFNNPELWDWIAGLKAVGHRPGLAILEGNLSLEDADAAEVSHIKRFKDVGQAEFNRAKGGRTNRGSSKLDKSTPDDYHALDGELIQLHADALEIFRRLDRHLPNKFPNAALEISRRIDDLRMDLNRYLSTHRPAWGRVEHVATEE